MSEVALKLSQLREAADQLYRSSLQIERAVREVRLNISYLVAAGLPLTGLPPLYGDFHGVMEDWARDIMLFATRLDEAADDVERAILNANTSDLSAGVVQPKFGSGFVALMRNRRRAERELEAIRRLLFPEPGGPPPLKLEDFIAGVNRPLYDQLALQKQALVSEQTRLDVLLQTRRKTEEDLIALRNRLLSFDQSADPSGVPRVRTLEGQLDRLDQEIVDAHGNVEQYQASIDDLTNRLERVKPGPGADLQLILDLEGAETSPWIKGHTQDCVNYVVSRMPIPEGIARHAFLWDDKAAQLTQYGVTSGDTPLVGSVVVLEKEHSYADDAFGHLLYVEGVEDGNVWVTDNLHPDEPIKLSDLTDELRGPYIKYLYFPWHTRA